MKRQLATVCPAPEGFDQSAAMKLRGVHPALREAAPTSPREKRDYKPTPGSSGGLLRKHKSFYGGSEKSEGRRLAPDIGHRVDTELGSVGPAAWLVPGAGAGGGSVSFF